MFDHLVAARGQSGTAASRTRWPLAARTLRRQLMDRRGTHHRRPRCAAFGIAANPGPNAATALRGGGRCAYAPAQPPRLAGCADGDSLKSALACRRIRLVSQWRALLAPPAASVRTEPRTAVGANVGDRRAMRFEPRGAALRISGRDRAPGRIPRESFALTDPSRQLLSVAVRAAQGCA